MFVRRNFAVLLSVVLVTVSCLTIHSLLFAFAGQEVGYNCASATDVIDGPHIHGILPRTAYVIFTKEDGGCEPSHSYHEHTCEEFEVTYRPYYILYYADGGNSSPYYFNERTYTDCAITSCR